jgi:cardiolipin synthase
MSALPRNHNAAPFIAILKRFATLAFVALAGCNTLPTIVPDMADNRPVVLEGSRGPLTPEQSKAILEKLKSRGSETSIFDRHLALEEGIGDTPLVIGNKVTLLKDGPATYQTMFAAIQGAKHHIHMETYIFDDDDVGNRFANALIDKQKEGVQVALMYDSYGSSATPGSFFKRLTDNGIKVTEFNPINPLTAKAGWQVTQRDHRKLLIVDGTMAFAGGINISGVYSTGSFGSGAKPLKDGRSPEWRDTHMQIEGPVVADFQKLFLEQWRKQKGPELADRNFFPQLVPKGKEVVRAIGSSPGDHQYSLMYATLISAIQSAETNVYLTNAYFVPDPQLRQSLKNAAKRGVDVKLILPSTTDFQLVWHAGRSYYSELLRDGVKIFERKGALLHAKTAQIDGVWSTIGSTNLDWRSFQNNDELNAVILGQDFGAQMQRMFDADLAASEQITLEKWEARPIDQRLLELSAKLWKYLL